MGKRVKTVKKKYESGYAHREHRTKKNRRENSMWLKEANEDRKRMVDALRYKDISEG